MGGSIGKSKSKQATYLSPEQSPYLQGLWQQGAQLTNQLQPQAANAAFGQADALRGFGQTGLGALSGIAGGQNAFIQNLAQRSQGNNPFAQQQVSALGNSLGQFWENNLLPGIASGAEGSGGLGGTRQSVAQGLAAQGLINQFGAGAADIYANSYNQGLGAAQAGLGSQLGAAGQIPGSAEAQFNLGLAPFQAAYLPLQQLAQLIGPAFTIGKGYSWNRQLSGGIGG